MRWIKVLPVALVGLALAAPAAAQDQSKAVSNGGIKVPGWMGRIDNSRENTGLKLEDALFAKMGDGFHVTTGPAVGYWHPNNKASGNYTVKATFREDKFQGLNNHPHPYGVFIGGNDMGTENQTYLYCMAYGNGTFIVRGFGPAPFPVTPRREANPAVNKAAGVGQPVTQEIALSVKGDKVECSINGTVVGSYDKSAVVGEGKLKSTDGVYGIRFGHNTEAMVTGFQLIKN